MEDFKDPAGAEGLQPEMKVSKTDASVDRDASPERLSEATSEADTLLPSGEAASSSSPSNTNLMSSQEAEHKEELNALIRMSYDSMLLPKDYYSGEIESVALSPLAKFAIDWLEESYLVTWSSFESEQFFIRLRELRLQAREERTPQQFELAGQVVSIQPFGIGTGRQQRLEHRFDFPGVMVAFSEIDGESRQHANFYLKITGEGCLLYGANKIRDLIHAMIEDMGGTISDSWVRRIDLCLDLPELSLEEWLLPAFEKRQFLTSAQKWNVWDGKQGCSGFTVGNSKSVTLNVYDKLRHSLKQSEAYQLGMIQHRWGGQTPKAATRIEYQIRKPWLSQFKLNDSDNVLICQPGIVSRLTEISNRPFFAMTADQVDRKNKHQSRSTPHPEWVKLMATFRHLVGTPAEPLKKIERGSFSHERACQMLVGFATTAAANAGIHFETPADLGKFVAEIIADAGYDEERIQNILHKKSLAAGTVKEATSFDFGANAEGDKPCS